VSIDQLLVHLNALGIRLWVDGERLRFDAPKGAITPELRDQLVAVKPELIARLRRDQPPTLTSIPRSGSLPLSFGQRRQWFLAQLDPNNSAYNMLVYLGVHGPLDADALERSFSRLLERHEILRAICVTVDGVPQIELAPPGPFTLARVDVRGPSAIERAREFATAEGRRPIDLALGPMLRASLLRLTDHEHHLYIVAHHFVTDGFSLSLLLQELWTTYGAIRRGTDPELAPLPFQYVDYAAWQRASIEDGDTRAQLEWWTSQLAAPRALLDVPSDRPRPARQTGAHGLTHWQVLPRELFEQLQALSRRHGVTLFMTMVAALQVLLHRYTHEHDVTLGTAVSNRPLRELEGLVGFFGNTLPLRTDLRGAPSFAALLERVREVVVGALAHQDVPFERLVDELGAERDQSRAPLFQWLFGLQVSMLELPEQDGLSFEMLESESGGSKFDVSILGVPDRDGLHVSWECDAELFDRSTVARMAEHLHVVLDAVVEDPTRSISSIPLLTADERTRLLTDFNATASPFPEHALLHELFEAQVERAPEALAVIAGTARLSYRVLDEAANRMAAVIAAHDVRPGELIAVIMDKGWEQIVACLAVLKAGGAYLPVEATLPDQRVAYLLEHGRCRLALTQARARVPAVGSVELLVVEDAVLAGPVAPRQPRRCDATQLAYVIFTSGSTGKPKGVMIEHGGAVNTCIDVNERFGIGPGDRMLGLSALGFDLSVYDLFGILAAGATLVLPPADASRDPAVWVRLIDTEQVTIWNTVPALLDMLVEYCSGAGQARLDSLRLALLSGDWIPLSLPDRARALGRELRMISMGGATEASIWSIIHPITEIDPSWRSIPYGRPMKNQRWYVLDEHGQPCPTGVRGALHIAGTGLARGYWRDEDLTAAKFFDHPGLGERLYRTGDLGRFLADGEIEFLGREDTQVKIQGHRIELGEIEAVLGQHPDVVDAAVDVRRDAAGVRGLVAWVIAGERRPDQQALTTTLRAQLPSYMIPRTIVEIDRFPLTTNGKLDRAALPSPELRVEQATTGRPPQTPAELVLAAIWCALLGLDEVGVHDNFFALGGDSILSIQVTTRANQAGLGLVPRQIFEHPTIAALAEVATTTRVTASEQGVLVGEVPLTPIQKWFFERFDPVPAQWNQSVVVVLREPVEPRILSEAIAALVRHHDGLRLRFATQRGGWVQRYVAPDERVPFESIDLRAETGSESTIRYEREVARVQASMDLEHGPMFSALHVRDGAAAQRLVLAAHHLVVDAVSWQILLEDLETACKQLRQGQLVSLPAKTASYRQWARAQQIYADSEILRERASAWRSLAAEPSRSMPCAWGREASTRRAIAVLDADVTKILLRDAPAKLEVSLENLLLALVARVAGEQLGRRRLLIELEGYNRDELPTHPGAVELELQRTVGWFTALFPIVLELDPELDAFASIDAVQRQRAAGPRDGGDYGALRYLATTSAELSTELGAAAIPELGFNYMGRLDGASVDAALFELSGIPGAMRASSCARMHRWDIDCFCLAGRLHLWWAYSCELDDPARIEAQVRRLGEALEDLARALDQRAAPTQEFPELQLDDDEMSSLYEELGLGVVNDD
jgi:amino acid adenylation domain-containing protein/non-ribosomal peptide synthase protein (TIGR01720 family)